LREEATKVKQIVETQTEELEETIVTEKKEVEKTEKVITESKTKLTGLRAKEKEINIKITSATDSSTIESYKAELTSITTEITTTKTVIKSSTQKKTSIT
jgi:capsule polysaccharide export protein KpsE/RkpR